ncbi:MAG: helix-turn-helix transcriptional regulator [Clostridia bacterium]|nr:helix-turn-helix transcriptional regulator [Clostridia bacterium]
MKLKISENIKNLRISKGLTQSELALLLSVTPQSVSRWENGQAYPDMETLPLLSNIFGVSYDELMGATHYDTEKLRRSFFRLKYEASLSPSYETELRALQIGEELTKRDPKFLVTYFPFLVSFKEKYGEITETQIRDARARMRQCLRESDFSTKIYSLYDIVAYENDAELEVWKDEYALPYYYRHLDFWDELLLFRYYSKHDAENHEKTSEKIIFEKLGRAISLLSCYELCAPDERWADLKPLQNHKAALDMINLYSSRFDDIFCMIRTVTEFRYALSLFENGLDEEGFSMLETVKEHVSTLCDMPDGKLLYGSVPPLEKAFIKLEKSKFYTDQCLMNIMGTDKNPRYGRLSENRRFVEFFEYVNSLGPKKGGSICNDEHTDLIDESEWEPLLSLARKKCPDKKDGSAVIAKSCGGNYYSFVYDNISDASEADGFLKTLVGQLESPQDTKIEKLVCMWHGGAVDLPSFALRDMLCRLNPDNLDADILVLTRRGLSTKKLWQTMRRGYKEKFGD